MDVQLGRLDLAEPHRDDHRLGLDRVPVHGVAGVGQDRAVAQDPEVHLHLAGDEAFADGVLQRDLEGAVGIAGVGAEWLREQVAGVPEGAPHRRQAAVWIAEERHLLRTDAQRA